MSGSLTWIGTATTLLRYGGFTVLTDPNFLHRGQLAYLGKGLVSRRLTDPAVRLEDLPPLDAVVLSHLHGDHFDRVARRGLPRDVPVLTTPAAARTLRGWGFSRAVGLSTWSAHELRSPAGDVLRVTAAPGRHARGPLQALLPPVMGSVLEYRPAGDDVPLSVYVTGDTLVVDDLREVPRRHPSLDLGLWHLGGTRIPGVLGLGALVTMDGRQGADLLELVRPTTVVPIHHGDYGVFTSPLSDFLDEVGRRGLPGVRPLERGQELALPVGGA
jgi:L-ascorbate metabolism protein UlaG (beta-lactamase superfamily)